MDGAAFQGMPRIALTPAEESLVPRPHSSASQVATAVPTTYTRTASPPPASPPQRHPHHPHFHKSNSNHPYFSSSVPQGSSLTGIFGYLGSPSTSSVRIDTGHSTPQSISRPSSPGPPRPSSPSIFQAATSTFSLSSAAHNSSNAVNYGGNAEQEYPQNPQDNYYSQVPPSRASSPGLPRLAFALSPRPARSPSPQLYGPSYGSTYAYRSSHESFQPRPGSPLHQGHQDSWDSHLRAESPSPFNPNSDDDDDPGEDSDDEGESSSEQGDEEEAGKKAKSRKRPSPPRRSGSKSIFRRLREKTSRLSFGDESQRSRRVSQDSQDHDTGPRSSQESTLTSQALYPLEGGEQQQLHWSTPQGTDPLGRQSEPDRRKSQSKWRPSLSLIRQESTGSNTNLYLQNNPHRISGPPPSLHAHGNNSITASLPQDDGHHVFDSENSHPQQRPDPSRKRGKSSKNRKGKRKRHGGKKNNKRGKKSATAASNPVPESTLPEGYYFPNLIQVLEKKTFYPLGYNGFEAYLRSVRAVEYLNFWEDVTAHEQLCRTFDVSERRQKRELQLEERAIARDRRRTATITATDLDRLHETDNTGRLSPAQALLGAHGARHGLGIGLNGQEINGSSLYAASRSSLQLPLHDHLSFPQETRRYGIQDTLAPFPSSPVPSQLGNHGSGSQSPGAYNRLLAGTTGSRRHSGETSRVSIDDPSHSEHDVAVAAVAMGAQRNGLYSPESLGRDDARRESHDLYRPSPSIGAGASGLRFNQNNSSNIYLGGGIPSAYNLTMRGRGSIDGVTRSTSRSSRTRPANMEDYSSGNGARRVSSQNLPQQQHHLSPLSSSEPTKPISTEDSSPDQLKSELVVSEQGNGDDPSEPHHPYPEIRFGSGVGPLQAPAMIRNSGESSYSPSIFGGIGQEAKALLVQSFRTISFEDVQESALRIYRKYLIQLRTAPMAAEEEAVTRTMAAAATDVDEVTGATPGRPDLVNPFDRTMSPGWDGYAEEVIAQWNESWKGRNKHRRSSRWSTRRGTAYANAVRHRDGPFDSTAKASASCELAVDTNAKVRSIAGSDHKEEYGQEEADEEDETAVPSTETSKRGTGKKSTPSSPTSPMNTKLKRRTGTGLSAMLNPLLVKLMLTETTVVELPTLTINTTTEEAAIDGETDEEGEYDSEDYDSDEEDDDDDEDSDGDSDDEPQVENQDEAHVNIQSEKQFEAKDVPTLGTDPLPKIGAPTEHAGLQSEKQEEDEEVSIVVVDRSMPFPARLPTPDQSLNQREPEPHADTHAREQQHPQEPTVTFHGVEQPPHHGPSEVTTAVAAEARRRANRLSSSSSLSSSWDRVSKREAEKSVTIVPPTFSLPSKRQSLYSKHPGGVRSVRERSGNAMTMPSKTAHRIGLQLSTFLGKRHSKSRGGSDSSLDEIPVTPRAVHSGDHTDFPFQIPEIVVPHDQGYFQIHPLEHQGRQRKNDMSHGNGVGAEKYTQAGSGNPMSSSRPMSTSTTGTNMSFVQLQGEPLDSSALQSMQGLERHVEHNGESVSGGGMLAPPDRTLGMSPTVSSLAISEAASGRTGASPVVGPPNTSLAPGFVAVNSIAMTRDLITASAATSAVESISAYAAPATSRFSVSVPSANKTAATAAVFYLPLECRQRIHTQIREEGRTDAPHLFGPAKGFVVDIVLADHYYPMFLTYMSSQNLGMLTRNHPKNRLKKKGMIWIGAIVWLMVIAAQITMAVLGGGGWASPWVWVVGVVGGWTGSVCLMTGVKEFSPVLGLFGKVCEDKHLFRLRTIQEASIVLRHRRRAIWMWTYCIFWSTMIMVVFAALPQGP